MSAFRKAAFAAAFGVTALCGAMILPAVAEMSVEVGGAPMYPSRNIIENAANSKDHTTLVSAVKAAGLVETLEGNGPFTVLAPVNKAFDKLPKGTIEKLLLPENKAAHRGAHLSRHTGANLRCRLHCGYKERRRPGHVEGRRG